MNNKNCRPGQNSAWHVRGRPPAKGTVASRSTMTFTIDASTPEAEAKITPDENEYVEAIEIYGDDSGSPDFDNWIGWMYFFSQSGDEETWVATDLEFVSGEPQSGHTYHGVAFISTYVQKSDSDGA